MTLVALNQISTVLEKVAVPFSYAAWKLQAALLHPVAVEGIEVDVYEAATYDPGELAEAILARRPDVVGFSAYLWSFSQFAEATRIIKRRRPECTVLFGGPSGRPAMFDLPEFRDVRALVGGVCAIEGEGLLRAVIELRDRSPDALRTIPGLAVPAHDGWYTAPGVELAPLDTLPSPYQLGLVKPRSGANLETFRGCPLSCSFCEWGALGTTGRVFSEAYVTRELEALRAADATSVYMIDAGLNLNRKAFRNLVAAEREVGFLRTIPVGLEIYATAVNDADVEFLLGIMVGRIGIGLQTLDADVLRKLQRPFDEVRFMRGLTMLAAVPNTAIELIFGLPFDSPAAFKDTVRRAVAMDATAVHIFHSLVLPDGLMTRAPAGADVRFDPHTLKTTSASGWSERELRETMDWLDAETDACGGSFDSLMWRMPAAGVSRGRPHVAPGAEVAADATGHARVKEVPGIGTGVRPAEIYPMRTQSPSRRVDASEPVPAAAVALEVQHALGEAVQSASGGTWKLVGATRNGRGVLAVDCTFRGGPFRFELVRTPDATQCFRYVDGVAVTHTTSGSVLVEGDLAVLDRVARALASASLAANGFDPREAGRTVRLPVVSG